MKVQAIKCPTCKDTVFSRCRHDFRPCSCGTVAIDGGRDYVKISYKDECPKAFELEINQDQRQLYDDWNRRVDNFGLIKDK